MRLRELIDRPIFGVQAWRYLYLLVFFIGAFQDWFGGGELVDVDDSDDDRKAAVDVEPQRTPARFRADELEKVHEEAGAAKVE